MYCKLCEIEFDDKLESPNEEYERLCPECCYHMDKQAWEEYQSELRWGWLRE